MLDEPVAAILKLTSWLEEGKSCEETTLTLPTLFLIDTIAFLEERTNALVLQTSDVSDAQLLSSQSLEPARTRPVSAV